MDQRPLRAHLLQQGTGALNDNLFRQAFSAIIILGAASGSEGLSSAATLGLCFMIPFLLVAPLAGSLAERYPAHLIIRFIRGVEPLLCLLGGAAMLSGSLPLLMLTIAGFGIQSALFAPVKYAIVPDLVDDRGLEGANGQLVAATQIAILLGITLAFVADPGLLDTGPFAGLPPAGAVLMIALPVTVVGISAAWRMPAMAARDPRARLRPLAWAALLRSLGHRPGLLVPAISQAAFWATAAAVQLTMQSVSSEVFAFGEMELALMAAGLGIAMSAGALLTARLNTRAFPAALPLLAATGMGGCLLMAALAAGRAELTGFIAWLYGAAFCSSWWPVCMNTLLQRRSDHERRGEVFAATSFLGNIGTAAGFGLLTFSVSLALPTVVLAGLGSLLLLVAATAAVHYRLQLGAWLLTRLVRVVWRLQVRGLERVPVHGGALLVCNHQSYADALVLAASLPRPVRFIADRPYVAIPMIGWIMRLAGTIPIDGRRPSSVRAALELAAACARNGELVAIFPEGRLTRSGSVGTFRRGMERIAREAGVPIVPAAIAGLHRSFLGAALARSLPRPGRRVPVAFGASLPPATDCSHARAAVASLHAELSTPDHGDSAMSLAHAFLRRLRRAPRAMAVADDRGSLSHLQLGVAARALIPLLELTADETRVGVLLPPGRGGAIVNLALAFAGRTSVNLNHTAGEHSLQTICERAGLRTVVTARAYTDRIGRPDLDLRYVDLEDLLPALGTWAKLRATLALFCLPAGLLCKARLDDVATIVFSSGSTGAPKGVQLTQRQILANVNAMARHYDFRPGQDRILSPLPLFHSFGLSVGLWLGLCHGLPVIGQADPRDARGCGKLAREHGATFMVSTPTFARGYLRRVPAEDFASLRFAVVGAERCPPELCDRFRETYEAELYEGYGCTELGPVVSANRPDEERAGQREVNHKPGSIGRPLPGIEVYAIDPDSGERRDIGEDGLLIVRSPARMLGYLGDPERSAEVFTDDGGYNTGDIGHVDADGFLHITGRLARFAKIGGEMVPLDNVERALNEGLQHAQADQDDEPTEIAVAAVPDENKGERLVVLHTGDLPCTTEDLLRHLDQLPALFRPKQRDFYQVATIPDLGTGKRDLAGLNDLARKVAG